MNLIYFHSRLLLPCVIFYMLCTSALYFSSVISSVLQLCISALYFSSVLQLRTAALYFSSVLQLCTSISRSSNSSNCRSFLQ
jgi:hypothetical protein